MKNVIFKSKFCLVLLILLLSFALLSCGNKTQTNDNVKPGGEEASENIKDNSASNNISDTAPTVENSDTPAANDEEINNEDTNNTDEDTYTSKTSLAGIHLGDTKDNVIKVLGGNYTETENDEAAFFGEAQAFMEYESGATVAVGKETQTVLFIDVWSPKIETELGVKVGHSAKDALKKYREKYEEFQGMYSDGKNIGWFEVEEGVLLILDFDKDDGTRVNENVKDDSKVEEIVLAFSFHFE